MSNKKACMERNFLNRRERPFENQLTMSDFYDNKFRPKNDFLIPSGVSYSNEDTIVRSMNNLHQNLRTSAEGIWKICSKRDGARLVRFLPSVIPTLAHRGYVSKSDVSVEETPLSGYRESNWSPREQTEDTSMTSMPESRYTSRRSSSVRGRPSRRARRDDVPTTTTSSPLLMGKTTSNEEVETRPTSFKTQGDGLWDFQRSFEDEYRRILDDNVRFFKLNEKRFENRGGKKKMDDVKDSNVTDKVKDLTSEKDKESVVRNDVTSQDDDNDSNSHYESFSYDDSYSSACESQRSSTLSSRQSVVHDLRQSVFEEYKEERPEDILSQMASDLKRRDAAFKDVGGKSRTNSAVKNVSKASVAMDDVGTEKNNDSLFRRMAMRSTPRIGYDMNRSICDVDDSFIERTRRMSLASVKNASEEDLPEKAQRADKDPDAKLGNVSSDQKVPNRLTNQQLKEFNELIRKNNLERMKKIPLLPIDKDVFKGIEKNLAMEPRRTWPESKSFKDHMMKNFDNIQRYQSRSEITLRSMEGCNGFGEFDARRRHETGGGRLRPIKFGTKTKRSTNKASANSEKAYSPYVEGNHRVVSSASSRHVVLKRAVSNIVASCATNRKKKNNVIAVENIRFVSRLDKIQNEPSTRSISFRQSRAEQLPFARIALRNMKSKI